MIVPNLSRVLCHVAPNSRRSILLHLANQIALDTGLHPVGVRDMICGSNTIVCTSIGSSVLMMDTLVDGLDTPYLLLANLSHSTRMTTTDPHLTQCIAVLLGQSTNPTAHLQLTASLARILKDPDFVHGWQIAKSPDAIKAAYVRASTTQRVRTLQKVA